MQESILTNFNIRMSLWLIFYIVLEFLKQLPGNTGTPEESLLPPPEEFIRFNNKYKSTIFFMSFLFLSSDLHLNIKLSALNILFFYFYIFVHKKRGHIFFIMLHLYQVHVKRYISYYFSGGFYGVAEAAE